MNTKTTLHNLSLRPALGVAAMLTIPVIAFAAANVEQPSASPSVTRSATVSLGDLDLQSPAGLNVAHDRVRKVARHLCSSLSDAQDLSRGANYVICVDEAVTDAMLKIAGSRSSRIAQSPAGQRNAR